MKKIFLGGTCNNSPWRSVLIPLLQIKYFDPVVSQWTEAAYEQELYEREHCDFLLYTITPLMTGVYSIAELVDDSNKRPQKTIFCILKEDGDEQFNDTQLKSLSAVQKMVIQNGAVVFDNLDELAEYVNHK